MPEITDIQHTERWSFIIARGPGDDWPDMITGYRAKVSVRPMAITVTLQRPEGDRTAVPDLTVSGPVRKTDGTPGIRCKAISWYRETPPEWVTALADGARLQLGLPPAVTGVSWSGAEPGEPLAPGSWHPFSPAEVRP